MKKILSVLWLGIVTYAIAAPLHGFQFKNPASNSSGYSQYALTSENQTSPQSLWDKLVETSYAR